MGSLCSCFGNASGDAPAGATDIERFRVEMNDFTFDGVRTRAYVANVYDGDTVRLRFEHGGRIVQWRCRLDGIDAPEMKPLKTSHGGDEKKIAAEKIAAVAARDALEAKLGRGFVTACFGKNDKYGRPLVRLFVGSGADFDVNRWMVDKGYAVLYDGGKKVKKEYVEISVP